VVQIAGKTQNNLKLYKTIWQNLARENNQYSIGNGIQTMTGFGLLENLQIFMKITMNSKASSGNQCYENEKN